MNKYITLIFSFLFILWGFFILVKEPFVVNKKIIIEKNEQIKSNLKEEVVNLLEKKDTEQKEKISNIVTDRFEKEEKKEYPDIAFNIRERILNEEIKKEEDCNIYNNNKDFCIRFFTENFAIKNNRPELCVKYNDSDSSRFNCIFKIKQLNQDSSICNLYLTKPSFLEKCIWKKLELWNESVNDPDVFYVQ